MTVELLAINYISGLRMTLGILMLETRFQRFIGDIGCKETWDFPVIFKVVKGASAAVATSANPFGLLQPFIKAGLELIEEGATLITTSCGFLAIFQKELQSALNVPVFTSSLLQAPLIKKPYGILTFDAETLTKTLYSAPIEGLLPTDSMRLDILGGKPTSFETRETQVLATAKRLLTREPQLQAILLECTNFPPHSKAIENTFGVEVYDVVKMMKVLNHHPKIL